MHKDLRKSFVFLCLFAAFLCFGKQVKHRGTFHPKHESSRTCRENSRVELYAIPACHTSESKGAAKMRRVQRARSNYYQG